jgi:AraC family transcriptional regulator
MTEQYGGRDRLRELLDAVLGEDNRSLEDMAGSAHSSAFHFSRQLSRHAGEPPVAMRRRVMLERAAWQLRHGSSVTDAAFAAGYDSVEGFSRAFHRAYGHVPSQPPDSGGHWLPAPNGIHFHPPTNLWIHTGETTMNPLVDQLLRHDLDDTRHLLDRAKQLGEGVDESLAELLTHLVFSKEVWLAAIEGTDFPQHDDDSAPGLLARHDAAAPRWLETVRDIDRRGAWDDRIVDALCDPPESFVLSSIVAHVLTHAAHRRQLVRDLLRAAGVLEERDDGDPITWLRAEYARGES